MPDLHPYARHFGGVRQGMAISWPAVIRDKGGIRNQFHHMIDIAPNLNPPASMPLSVSDAFSA
jgi:arylsulfatase